MEVQYVHAEWMGGLLDVPAQTLELSKCYQVKLKAQNVEPDRALISHESPRRPLTSC